MVGPFDRTGGGMERQFGPEAGFDPGARYKGKYGTVRWRHTRLPIDGRDIHANFPAFDIRKILTTKGEEEIAYLYFRIHSQRKGRFNLVTDLAEPCRYWLNGEPAAISAPLLQITQVNLEAGDNEFLIKAQRGWGEWDFRAAITSFATCGPAEGLTVPANSPK